MFNLYADVYSVRSCWLPGVFVKINPSGRHFTQIKRENTRIIISRKQSFPFDVLQLSSNRTWITPKILR